MQYNLQANATWKLFWNFRFDIFIQTFAAKSTLRLRESGELKHNHVRQVLFLRKIPISTLVQETQCWIFLCLSCCPIHSLDAIKTLSSNVAKSNCLYNCKQLLELINHQQVELICVSGHQGIEMLMNVL